MSSAAVQEPSPLAMLARSIGLSAFVYGYPLVEMMRTCALQTSPAGTADAARPPIDSPLHWTGPTQATDRDVVTPANDLMYTTAWINLAGGPRLLRVPSAKAHPSRYFVLALYDAYTENFANLGPSTCDPNGEVVVLVGPRGAPADSLPAGLRVVRVATDLVWLIARILVIDADDLPSAKKLQAEITIEPLPGSGRGRRPLAVEQWSGDTVDAMAAILDQDQPPASVAPHFYANLCHALADAPGRTEDVGHVEWFGRAGLKRGDEFDWQRLSVEQRQGLVQGLADGVALIASATRHRSAKPWVTSWRNGRYGNDYQLRAIVTYIGLGALVPDEAVYIAGHFDADGMALDGTNDYTLRLGPDEQPPADAFWSVTLYDADRFLYANDIARHAIGDRTRGLAPDTDGGLTICFSHAAPPNGVNWMPTPAGPFYLVLRLYHPRAEARGWVVPPLRKVAS